MMSHFDPTDLVAMWIVLGIIEFLILSYCHLKDNEEEIRVKHVVGVLLACIIFSPFLFILWFMNLKIK
jgi:hypothetical protein